MNTNSRSMQSVRRHNHYFFSTQKTALTLVEAVIVLVVIGLLVALLLPSVRTPREAARRNQCQNQLKEIALALQNYSDVHGSLPPAYTTDADGKPLHSWRTLILPFMGSIPQWDSIDLSKPWDDPANARVFKSIDTIYQCPSTDIDGNLTTYLAVVTPSSVMRATDGRKLSEFRDLEKPRLTVIEVDEEHAVPWMAPTDADENLMRAIGRGEVKSRHPNGSCAAFSDCSTQVVGDDVGEERLFKMISVDAGEDAAKPAEEPTGND